MFSAQRLLPWFVTAALVTSGCAGPSKDESVEPAPPVPPAPARPEVSEDGFALTAPRFVWFVPGAAQGLDRPCVRGPLLFTSGPEVRLVRINDGKVMSTLQPPKEVPPRATPKVKWRTPTWIGPVLVTVRADGWAVGYDPQAKPLWQRQVGKVALHSALEVDDLAVFATGERVIALRAATGELAWAAVLDAPIDMQPATDGERVFVGTRAGELVALNVHDGEPAWRQGGLGAFSPNGMTCSDGVVYAVDWGLEGPQSADELGKRLKPGPRGSGLFAFDSETGRPKWSVGLAAKGASRPFVDQEFVWLGFSNVVVPFALADGVPALERGFETGRNPFGSPMSTSNAVVFGNFDGHLYVHDRKTGRVRWSFTPGENPAGSPEELFQVYGFSLAGETLVVRTQAGYCALIQDPEASEPVVFETALRAN